MSDNNNATNVADASPIAQVALASTVIAPVSLPFLAVVTSVCVIKSLYDFFADD